MIDVMEKVIDLQKTLDNFIKNAGIEYNKAVNLQIANQLAIAEMKREFEEEIRKSNTELNKKIGEQANRLGQIVEDLVLPSMPRVIIEKFGFELERFFINYKGKDNGRYKEYDAVGVYKDLVFICSSKSLLREKNIAEFQSDLAEFRYWFPEYKDKKLIGIFAAVTLPENMIPFCEKEGFLVMGIGSEIMELKNTEGFIPREY